EVPYVVAVVELREGPRLLTNIVGCAPGEVYCEMPVTVVWEDITPDITLPKFAPSG
ncbi:MAG TPA: OB-fold domain-containing protein, partial [Deltaproteobacteria bacterium]|nr:OB-fold domain-containing protein [Deltaproteobacteria bacterium]